MSYHAFTVVKRGSRLNPRYTQTATARVVSFEAEIDVYGLSAG